MRCSLTWNEIFILVFNLALNWNWLFKIGTIRHSVFIHVSVICLRPIFYMAVTALKRVIGKISLSSSSTKECSNFVVCNRYPYSSQLSSSWTGLWFIVIIVMFSRPCVWSTSVPANSLYSTFTHHLCFHTMRHLEWYTTTHVMETMLLWNVDRSSFFVSYASQELKDNADFWTYPRKRHCVVGKTRLCGAAFFTASHVSW